MFMQNSVMPEMKHGAIWLNPYNNLILMQKLLRGSSIFSLVSIIQYCFQEPLCVID